MMRAHGEALRTGFFVLASFAVLVGLILVLSGSIFRQGLAYETYFKESVQGLDVGSPVKFRGVTIGKVTEIGLVAAQYPPANAVELNTPAYRQVIVRFRVNPAKLGPHPNIKEAIERGLRAEVAPQGITGLAYLELTFVNPTLHPVSSVPWTPRTPEIPSIPSTLTQVQDAVQGFLANARDVDVAKTIHEVNGLITAMHEELTTGAAKQAIARADELLGELQDQVRQANLPGTTASVRRLADGKQTREILQQLQSASAALEIATAAMPELVAETKQSVRLLGESTMDFDREMIPIMRNLNTVSRRLAELSAELQSNPAVLLRGREPPRQTP